MNNILCIFVLALCASASAGSISRIVGGETLLQNRFPYVLLPATSYADPIAYASDNGVVKIEDLKHLMSNSKSPGTGKQRDARDDSRYSRSFIFVSLQQISRSTEDTRGHICGGVLITPEHVLTSASCTYNYSIAQTPPVEIVPSEIRVFAGSVTLTNVNAEQNIRLIKNITRHPQFIDSPALVNDIAVLTLDNPFNNTVVSPLSLPAQDFIPAEYTQCVVAGWGSTEGSTSASVNQNYASKYISDWELCRFQYNTASGVLNLLPSMICALPTNNNAAGCMGDYGNAIVCDGGLTGILISSKNCNRISSLPEVYTRVSNYTTWIRSVTGGASTFQPALAVLMMLTVVQLITAKIIS